MSKIILFVTIEFGSISKKSNAFTELIANATEAKTHSELHNFLYEAGVVFELKYLHFHRRLV